MSKIDIDFNKPLHLANNKTGFEPVYCGPLPDGRHVVKAGPRMEIIDVWGYGDRDGKPRRLVWNRPEPKAPTPERLGVEERLEAAVALLQAQDVVIRQQGELIAALSKVYGGLDARVATLESDLGVKPKT